jgi:putative cell wall-binding protein
MRSLLTRPARAAVAAVVVAVTVATATTAIAAAPPTVEIALPATITTGATLQQFEGRITNNSGADIDRVRVDFTITGISSLRAEDVIIEQQSGASFGRIPLSGTGTISGTIGPRTGVPIPNGGHINVTLRAGATEGAPGGTLAVHARLVRVDQDGNVVSDLATEDRTVLLRAFGRVFGSDRISTAIAVSKLGYGDGVAAAGVLARSDNYPDALAGTPLAAAKKGPLLLTPPQQLDPRVGSELKRALPAGATVYLLGGQNALGAAVEDAVRSLGFTPVRLAGGDRYETATVIADQGLANPTTVLLATGANFPDALAAGAAAPTAAAAVLLTSGSTIPPATSTYLTAHPPKTRYAIGGPAAAADPSATAIVGGDRFDTARKVAAQFFPAPRFVGIASGQDFPDALSGGSHVGKARGPVLLVSPTVLPPATQQYLQGVGAGVEAGFLDGGPAAVSDAVRTAAADAIG